MSPLVSGRTIRSLAVDDISLVQRIDTAAHGEQWSHRTFVDEVERDDRIHLVAETAGDLVGHASLWLDGASARITNVATSPDHGSAGHAPALLVALLRAALAHRAVSNLQLEVRPSNRRAQRLYSRFGFVPVGIERNFYDRGDAQGSRDALVMAVADVCSDSWRSRLNDLDLNPGEGAAA